VSDSISVAFAGPADVTPEAIKALLNDYLGFGPDDADGFPAPSDREIELIFPIREDHLSQGLLNVLAWSADVDLPYTAVVDKGKPPTAATSEYREDAAEVVPVANVNAQIVDLLAHAEGEGVLVLLWGEGDDAGDEDTEMLLDLALAEKVKVVDLTAGLDDMTFADEEPEPEPDPEPAPARRTRRSAAKAEAEPEKPARRGSRRAAATEEAEPDSGVDEGTVTEKPARRGRSRKAEEPLVQPEEPLVDEPVAEEPAKPARRARKAAKPEMTTEEATKDYWDRLNAMKEKAYGPAEHAAELAEAREEAVEESGEEAVQRVEKKSGTTTETPRTVYASLDQIRGTLSSVYLYFTKQTELISLATLTSEVEETPLAVAVREAMEALEAGLEWSATPVPEAPKRGRGRPRKEPDENDTTAYFEDGDGIIRVATRGRPRSGETRVELTALEVQVKTEAGLLED